MINKVCLKCKEAKSLSEFHKSSRNKDGLKTYCKECKKKENLEYRNRGVSEEDREKRNNYKRVKREELKKIKILIGEIQEKFDNGKEKECTRCLEIKSYSEYDKKKGKYISHCKKCERIRYLLWYKDNKEKVFKYQKKYIKENPAKLKLWAKNSRDNADKKQVSKSGKEWRDKNKERMAELKREWRKKNPEKDAEYNHKRRVRLGEISLTADEIKEVKKKYNNICYWCNKKIKGTQNLDHYEPISKGGKNTIDNTVLSCSHCNKSKGAKSPTEYARTIGKLL